MSKGWDNITLKKLKALVGKGLSTSEMGKRLGLSKNAVVGKLNRLGWNAKAGSVASNKNAPARNKKTSAKPAAKTTTTKSKTKVVAKKTNVKVPSKKMATKPATKKIVVTSKGKKTAATKSPVKAKPQVQQPKTKSKTSAKNLAMHQRIIQHSLEMANLKPNQCRWPIGDPDSENFHFCGKTVFTGKPYCYEHCRLAYQFTPPKKKQ